MADILAVLRADTSQFSAGLAKAKAETKELSDSGSSNFSKLGTFGKAATMAIGAGVIAAGAASVDLAMKYQTSTAQIAASSGISIAAAQKIGNAFLNTAGTTVYSGQQIATAYGQVAGQLKFTEGHALNSSQAMQVMRAAMDGAEASGESLGSTTTALAAVMQAYHLKTSQASSAMDILYNISRATNTPISGLTTIMDRLHGRLGALAPSLQDVGTLMTFPAIASQGSRGAMIVNTALQTLLGGSKATDGALSSLGVTLYNASGKFVGMRSVVEQLQPKLAGLTQAQQMAAEKTLFGASAAQLMGQVVAGGASGYDKAAKAADKMGSAHDAAAKKSGTLKEQLETVKSTVQDYATKIGGALIPKLEEMLKVGLKVVAFLEKHRAVAIALAVVVGGVLTTAFAAWAVSLVMVDGALSPIVVPMLAVIGIAAALAAVAYEVIHHWGAISGFFKKIWGDVEKIFEDVWHGIETVIKVAWNIIKTVFEDATIVGLILSHWTQIKNDAIRIWNDIVSFFTGIPDKLVNGLKALGSKITSWISGVWDTFKGWIETAWNNEVAFWTTIPEKLINAVIQFGSKLLSWINTAWNNFKSWIEGAWNNEVAFWTSLPDRLINAVISFGSKFAQWISDAWTAFTGALNTGWTAVSNFFTQMPGKIISGIGNLLSGPNSLVQKGIDLIQGLINGIGSMVQKAVNAATSLAGKVVSGIGHALGLGSPSKITFQHGQWLVEGLANGMIANLGLVTGAASRVAGAAMGSLGTSFGSPNAGITPIAGIGGGGGAGVGGTLTAQVPVIVQIDDTRLAQTLQTVMLRYQRGSSVPVFGTTQSGS